MNPEKKLAGVMRELDWERSSDPGGRDQCRRLMRLKAVLEELDEIWPDEGEKGETPHQRAWEEWALLSTRWDVASRNPAPGPVPPGVVQRWKEPPAVGPSEEKAEEIWPDD